MLEKDPIKNDRRKHRRRMKLPEDPACAICGEMDPEGLKELTVPKRLLEDHHVVGRANDEDLTIVACLTHHRLLHARMEDASIPLQRPGNILDWLIAVLRSLAAFFDRLTDALLRWAARIQKFVAALDREYPAWRKIEEAA